MTGVSIYNKIMNEGLAAQVTKFVDDSVISREMSEHIANLWYGRTASVICDNG